ncbi:MAG: right-handed parallel beta-helix repeat-containing protein [Candidatus Cloacimonadales bacterium]
MKKLLCFLSILIIISMLSATDISGNLSGDLELADSPYYLVGDLFVPTDTSLEIEPGVEIIATGYYRFEVNGAILAIGTAEQPIIFRGEDDFDWRGIRLDSGGSEAESEFVYCQISNTNALNDHGIHVINTRVSIDNCEIFDHEKAVTFSCLTTDNPVPMSITNSLIYDCIKSGITVVDQSNLIIDNNEITNCGLGTQFYGAIQLSLQSDSHSCSPTISNNWLHNNAKQGLTLANLFGYENMAPTVVGNLIEENLTGVYLYSGKGEFRQNIIRNNFIENDANSGAGVMLYGTDDSAVFSENQVYGNYCGFYLTADATVNLGNLENETSDDDGYNLIYDNVFFDGTPFNINNTSNTDIMAQNNVWDSDDTDEIEARLVSSGNINYQPFLSILAPAANLEIISEDPLSISWEAAYNTHAEFLGYQILLDSEIIAEDNSTATYTFSEIPEYPFTLEIIAQYTEGNASALAHTFEAQIANPPLNLDYTIEDATVLLEWDAPAAGSSAEFAFYRVYFQDESYQTNDTWYQLSELEPNQEYTVGLSAVYENELESEIVEVSFELEANNAEPELTMPTINLHNYPNPFMINNSRSASTTISFDLTNQEFQQAEVKIYNSKGQLIRHLPVANNSAREVRLSWDGRNSEQKLVASGIYYYQLLLDDKNIAAQSCTILK